MSNTEPSPMQPCLAHGYRRGARWLLALWLTFALSACGKGQLSEQDKKILTQLRHNGIAFDDKKTKREHGALVIDQPAITGSDGTITRAKRLVIRQYDTAHPNPYTVDATMEGVLLPLPDVPVPEIAPGKPPADPAASGKKGLSASSLATNPALADALENGHIPLNATLHYQYDEQARRLRLENFFLQSPKLFGLSLQITMSDFDPVFFQQNERLGLLKPTELLNKAAAESRLDNAALTYTDRSMIERLFTLLGEQQHVTPQVIRDGLKGALSMAIMSSQVQGDAFMRDALMAFSSFLEHPGTLKLTARPSEPVRMGELQAQGEQWKRNPAALVQTLGIKLEALPAPAS